MTEIVSAPAAFTEESFRPQPDGSIDPAGEAGWFLQRERERRVLSLEHVAAETGIHESHLEGIEHGDLTKLPSRMEALKMVGIYGQYLGFDPEPLIVHYADFLPRPIAPAQPGGGRTPRPLSSATVISFRHVLQHGPFQRTSRSIGSCLVAMVLFSAAVWLLIPGSPGEEATAAIDPLPTASVALEPELDAVLLEAQVAITETPMPNDGAQTSPENDTEPRRENEQASLAALIARTTGDGDAADLPELAALNQEWALPGAPEGARNGEPASSQGRIIGEGNAAARIVLKANGPVLIRIEDSRGNIVVSHTLATGDRYQVPSRDDLVVVAGDGGLVGVEIDGVASGTLGTPGEIVVGRPLTVSTLRDGQG